MNIIYEPSCLFLAKSKKLACVWPEKSCDQTENTEMMATSHSLAKTSKNSIYDIENMS